MTRVGIIGIGHGVFALVVEVEAKQMPFFKCGKDLRERLNAD